MERAGSRHLMRLSSVPASILYRRKPSQGLAGAEHPPSWGRGVGCGRAPFWLLLPSEAHVSRFPPAKGGREADGREQSARGTGQTSPCPSGALSISLSPSPPPRPRHAHLSLYDSLGLSQQPSPLRSRCRPLPGTAALPSNASPSGQAGLCLASASLQPLLFHLPCLPALALAPGCPGLSPLGRFSSAPHVWVLCPAPTSSPHAWSR